MEAALRSLALVASTLLALVACGFAVGRSGPDWSNWDQLGIGLLLVGAAGILSLAEADSGLVFAFAFVWVALGAAGFFASRTGAYNRDSAGRALLRFPRCTRGLLIASALLLAIYAPAIHLAWSLPANVAYTASVLAWWSSEVLASMHRRTSALSAS